MDVIPARALDSSGGGSRRVIDGGPVQVGSRVQVKDGPDVDTFTIVGPEDADATAGRVSMDSPMGRALLGRRMGDQVRIDRPANRRLVTIAHVSGPLA
jgi:transcription elongation GreA/GreB family factor